MTTNHSPRTYHPVRDNNYIRHFYYCARIPLQWLLYSTLLLLCQDPLTVTTIFYIYSFLSVSQDCRVVSGHHPKSTMESWTPRSDGHYGMMDTTEWWTLSRNLLQDPNPGPVSVFNPTPVPEFKPRTSAKFYFRTQTQDQCQCSTQHQCRVSEIPVSTNTMRTTQQDQEQDQTYPGSHIVLTSYLYLIYTNIKSRHTASFCVRFRIESQDINNRSRKCWEYQVWSCSWWCGSAWPSHASSTLPTTPVSQLLQWKLRRSIEKMIPALLTAREDFTYPDYKYMG